MLPGQLLSLFCCGFAAVSGPLWRPFWRLDIYGCVVAVSLLSSQRFLANLRSFIAEFERIPDWNEAMPVPGSTEGVSASGVAAIEEMVSDVAVLRRVVRPLPTCCCIPLLCNIGCASFFLFVQVPELGEQEARMLLAASGGDLKAAMVAVLQQEGARL